MTPGQYLRKRREAAGFGIIQAAATLAALSMLPRQANPRTAIAQLLNDAEDDKAALTRDQLALIAMHAFPLDADVYGQLLVLHADPDNPDLPRPAVCRECGCSWYDACILGADPARRSIETCSWAEHAKRHRDGLCTGCLRKHAVTVESVLVSEIPVVPA